MLKHYLDSIGDLHKSILQNESKKANEHFYELYLSIRRYTEILSKDKSTKHSYCVVLQTSKINIFIFILL